MSNRLKKCPHCASKDLEKCEDYCDDFGDGPLHAVVEYIKCLNCGATGPTWIEMPRGVKDIGEATWNTRRKKLRKR